MRHPTGVLDTCMYGIGVACIILVECYLPLSVCLFSETASCMLFTLARRMLWSANVAFHVHVPHRVATIGLRINGRSL